MRATYAEGDPTNFVNYCPETAIFLVSITFPFEDRTRGFCRFVGVGGRSMP
jgi:hypothetical protein